MTGIFKLAYKLLVNDRSKFSALLVGLSCAVFLMRRGKFRPPPVGDRRAWKGL